MQKQKKGFLLFISSLIPGAGEMYMGFFKQGISIMTLFWAIIAIAGELNISSLVIFLPVLWFYSFFHVHNLKELPEEEFYAIEDNYILHLDRIFQNNIRLSQKHIKIAAILLIVFGVAVFWNGFRDLLFWILPNSLAIIIQDIMYQIPSVIIGILIIVAGYQLLTGKIKSISPDEKADCKKDVAEHYWQPYRPYQQPVDKSTYLSTLGFFDALLRLLHPFMPFITEELWQALEPRKEGESLMVALIPEVAPVDNLYLEDFEIAKEIVGGVRTIRLQKNIPNKEALELQVLGEHNDHFNSVIAKMCNLSSIIRTEEKAAGSASFLVRTTEYAVPLGNMINVEEELAKLQDELKYQQGFLASVMKKLSNESFVSKAPAKVIEMERKKQADAESKIKSIEESIAALKK